MCDAADLEPAQGLSRKSLGFRVGLGFRVQTQTANSKDSKHIWEANAFCSNPENKGWNPELLASTKARTGVPLKIVIGVT